MGIDQKDVTCVVVTRGNNTRGINRVLGHLNMYFDHLRVWDNAEMAHRINPDRDMKVYGRYYWQVGDLDIVYVQDDDCLVDIPEVLAHYEPGIVTCNIRHTHTDWYTDKLYNVAPVGWGAVFDRDLIQPAFDRYLSRYPKDDFFLRECDRIFTGLNRVKRIMAGCVNLPWAHDADRMGNEKRHGVDFQEAVRRVEELMKEEVGNA